MTAMKNAAHLVLVALWGLAGVVFSLKALFLGVPALALVVAFWVWFAGFVALTLLARATGRCGEAARTVGCAP